MEAVFDIKAATVGSKGTEERTDRDLWRAVGILGADDYLLPKIY